MPSVRTRRVREEAHLILIDSIINVVGKWASSNSCARVYTGHMVEDGIYVERSKEIKKLYTEAGGSYAHQQ